MSWLANGVDNTNNNSRRIGVLTMIKRLYAQCMLVKRYGPQLCRLDISVLREQVRQLKKLL